MKFPASDNVVSRVRANASINSSNSGFLGHCGSSGLVEGWIPVLRKSRLRNFEQCGKTEMSKRHSSRFNCVLHKFNASTPFVWIIGSNVVIGT